MILKLTTAEVDSAIKEFMIKRGLPATTDIEVYIKGGRKGNGGTVEVTVQPTIRIPDQTAAPQIYENLVEEDEDAFIVDAEQMAKDMETFDLTQVLPQTFNPGLHVVAKNEVVTGHDDPTEEDIAVFAEPPAPKKTIGALFGKEDIKPQHSDAPVKKTVNKGLFD